jgi:hypothetical protein
VRAGNVNGLLGSEGAEEQGELPSAYCFLPSPIILFFSEFAIQSAEIIPRRMAYRISSVWL